AASKQAVEDFFAGRAPPAAPIAQPLADYVFYGPRERKLGALPQLNGWRKVFQQGEVAVYGR
ncbi:MAG: hypothetical protein ACRDH2_10590, partial [Anaerolineales bacterium]